MRTRKPPYAVIYAIANIINGKAYIGMTQNPENRIYSHFKQLSTNKHQNAEMQEDYNRLGRTAFATFVVHEIADMQQAVYATEVESLYISRLISAYNIICKKNQKFRPGSIKLNTYLSIFTTNETVKPIIRKKLKNAA